MVTLNTAVLYGSARRNRQGNKAARFIVRKLEDRNHKVSLVDSTKCDLPFLDLMYKKYDWRVVKFLDEYEWYVKALKLARENKCPETMTPTQRQMCREKSSG